MTKYETIVKSNFGRLRSHTHTHTYNCVGWLTTKIKFSKNTELKGFI
jgi:hypothetical protein